MRNQQEPLPLAGVAMSFALGHARLLRFDAVQPQAINERPCFERPKEMWTRRPAVAAFWFPFKHEHGGREWV